MRHLNSKRRLGLTSRSHKKAMMSNMAMSLIKHKRIKTTHARAKELRRFIEPMITLAKRGDLHARRLVLRKIKHKETVHALFHDVAPVYENRPGGYTRITKLGFRDNDRADVSMIELIDLVGAIEKKSEKKESAPEEEK
ncbi:MAG: 50S ribosomal protein L17 [Candidatus Marinimicrobia bacterium]|nr:50S ribosomal protein L17 [Candidatus Neomarinimicrobiota bacterium]MBL7059623.1 50S ribosomal protein L17 [Candidatus Neomarinimicrobiota bacterium]